MEYNIVAGFGLIGLSLWRNGATPSVFIERSGLSLPGYAQSRQATDFLSTKAVANALGLNKPKAFVWAAGLTRFDFCERFPQVSFNRNIESLIAYAKCVRTFQGNKQEAHVPGTFIYLSSHAAVGKGTGANPKPIGTYGRHKLMGEQLLTDIFKGTQTKLVILRLANVVGLGYPLLGGGPSTAPAKRIFDRMALNEPFCQYISPNGQAPVRNFVDIGDVIDAIELASSDVLNGPSPWILNVSGGRSNTVSVEKFRTIYNDVATKVGFAQHNAPVSYAPLPGHEPTRLSLPCSDVFAKPKTLRSSIEDHLTSLKEGVPCPQ